MVWTPPRHRTPRRCAFSLYCSFLPFLSPGRAWPELPVPSNFVALLSLPRGWRLSTRRWSWYPRTQDAAPLVCGSLLEV